MANTNLGALGNVTPLNIDTSNFNNTGTLFKGMIDSANAAVGSLWYHASMMLIFMMLIYLLYKRDGDFLYDISRSILISSGFLLFLSIGLTLSEWVTSIFPIFWFTSIFLISLVGVISRKNKGL